MSSHPSSLPVQLTVLILRAHDITFSIEEGLQWRGKDRMSCYKSMFENPQSINDRPRRLTRESIWLVRLLNSSQSFHSLADVFLHYNSHLRPNRKWVLTLSCHVQGKLYHRYPLVTSRRGEIQFHCAINYYVMDDIKKDSTIYFTPKFYPFACQFFCTEDYTTKLALCLGASCDCVSGVWKLKACWADPHIYAPLPLIGSLISQASNYHYELWSSLMFPTEGDSYRSSPRCGGKYLPTGNGGGSPVGKWMETGVLMKWFRC